MFIQKTISDYFLINQIKKSILSNQPLSITRLGDGEFHILRGEDYYKSQNRLGWHLYIINDILKRNCFITNCSCKLPKHTGCSCFKHNPDSILFLSNLREIFIYAIKNSNFIGLNPDGVSSDEFKIEESLLKNKYHVNVKKLNVFNTRISKNKQLSDITNFAKIIQGKPIHIITSNTDRFKSIGFDKKIGSNVSYTDLSLTKRSYYQRDEILSSIYNIKEDIILIGGGGALKDLPAKISNELGKICLDIGSLLDAWSGNISRPIYANEARHAVWLPKEMCIGKYSKFL